jgi:1-acyl-sn-glycerol-3-phosphate acyltransferase
MILDKIIITLSRLLVGAAARWIGSSPSKMQRIYFANHTSHLDTIAIWSAMPSEFRKTTRPVAAADYWNKGWLRKHIAISVLNSVLVERITSSKANPLLPLFSALENGDSLIFFPEGTRSDHAVPHTFKSGLFHLAERFPDAELIPVYLENFHRCMPKGSFFPVPLVCTIRFGAKLERIEQENKSDFLERARNAILELS